MVTSYADLIHLLIDLYFAVPVSNFMISIPAESFAAVWLFMVGASIGSFLNVVAYRLPQGMSILGSSHCPKCRNNIRMYDNVPVFAWLFLRGRCRMCELEISPRYPIVEAIAGTVFLAVGVFDFALGASNLPGMPIPRYPGFAESLFLPNPANVVLYSSHVLLLMLLLAASLIEFDGHRTPRSLLIMLILGSITYSVISPKLPDRPPAQVARYNSPRLESVGSGYMQGDISLRMAGLLAGALLGLILVSLSQNPESQTTSTAIASFVWAFVGLWHGVFGLMSIFIIAATSSVLSLGFRREGLFSRVMTGPISLLSISTLVHILFWSRLAKMSGWPMNGYRGSSTVIWLGITIASLFLVALFRRQIQPNGAANEL